MSKQNLIDAVAEHADLTKDKASVAVNAMLSYIEKTLQSGEEVSIPPLGKFKIAARKAREGRNPTTGQTIQIPASNVPKFMPSKTLKDAVNKK